MRTIKTFILGIGIGFIASWIYFGKKKPLELEITQERGEAIKVISNSIDKKSELKTELYSETTGKITLRQKLPLEKAWYMRMGLMPNYSIEGFGMGGLIGFEYRTGGLGYFIDGYYDPIQKNGGVILGLSIKLPNI